MKQSLLIITALMLIVGCSKDVDEDDLYDDDGVYYQTDSDKPYTGKVVGGSYSSNDAIMYSGLYENGVLVGEYTFYNEDGSVKKPINLNELGELFRRFLSSPFDPNDGGIPPEPYTGVAFSLHSNGQKESEGILKDGYKEGLWTEWYENGQKKMEATYTGGMHNKWDGKLTRWYENGQKSREGNYKRTRKDGLWTRWYSDGELMSEGTYKDGKKDGKWDERELVYGGTRAKRRIWKNDKCCFDQYGRSASINKNAW